MPFSMMEEDESRLPWRRRRSNKREEPEEVYDGPGWREQHEGLMEAIERVGGMDSSSSYALLIR